MFHHSDNLDAISPSSKDPGPSSSSKASLPPSRIAQLRLIKWLLTSSSHLGRALAELFGLLVHQCVAPQPRIRRHLVAQHMASMPSLPARLVADQLTKVLIQGLSWVCPEEVSISRLRFVNITVTSVIAVKSVVAIGPTRTDFVMQ